jgi:hypothetical protein
MAPARLYAAIALGFLLAALSVHTVSSTRLDAEVRAAILISSTKCILLTVGPLTDVVFISVGYCAQF